MDFCLRLLGRIVDLTIPLGAFALLLMMSHIAIDVGAKNLFASPLPGTITFVSNYYMVAAAFLPLAFAERSNAHISVEVVSEHFPELVQRRLNVVTMAFSAVVMAALAWQSFAEAERARGIGAFIIENDHKLPVWPARYLLPLGAALMVVTLVAKIAVALRRRQPLDTPFF